MNRQTSIYLDLIRFCAALVVFIGHASGQRMTGGFLWPVADYMSQAVTVFFVLSGYVIGYVTDRRESTATAYIVARAARIYSVAIPALILTFALDRIGRSVDPAAYNVSWGYSPDNPLWQVVAHVLFVNRIWFSAGYPGSNLPFWTLGYEVWYYVIFGLWVFLPERRRMVAVALALAFVGPRIAALFPLWLAGVWCYRLSRSVRIAPWTGAALWAVCMAILGWYEVWTFRHGELLDGYPPAFLNRHELVQDYFVAALFALQLLGFNAFAPYFRIPERLANAVRWVAGATFSVYLFHLPVSQFLTVMSPWPHASAANRILVVGGTLLILFVLAELTERRKDIWRVGIAKLLRRIGPQPAE